MAIGTPQALIQSLPAEESVSFSIRGRISPEWQESLACIGKMDIQGERVTIRGQSNEATQMVAAVVIQLTGLKIPFYDLRTAQPTLEDVFLHLTGNQIRE